MTAAEPGIPAPEQRPSTSTATPMLSPGLRAQIQPLHLRARVVAEALLAGGHRSRRFGSSSEFAEHKLYTPGDDLRRLDWRVKARLDKNVVRRTEDETRLDVVLVVDASASMSYAGGADGTLGPAKLDVAKTIAAAIAYIAVHQADAPGVTVFAGDVQTTVPPRGRTDAFVQLCNALEAAQASSTTPLGNVLRAVVDRQRRRFVAVVVSDFIDCGAESLQALGSLARRGGEAIVLQVLHPDEIDFPFDGVVRFLDLEGDRDIQLDAGLVRQSYLEELRVFLASIADAAAAMGARHRVVRTDANLPIELQAVLDGAR